MQHEWDDPGAELGRGTNGIVQTLDCPSLAHTAMKTGRQFWLRHEAEMMGVCRHPNVAKAYAILLPRGVTHGNLAEAGHLVVERLVQLIQLGVGQSWVCACLHAETPPYFPCYEHCLGDCNVHVVKF